MTESHAHALIAAVSTIACACALAISLLPVAVESNVLPMRMTRLTRQT